MKRVARCVFIAACLGAPGWGASADDDNRVLHPAKAAPSLQPASGGLGQYSLLVGVLALAGGGWLLWRGRRRGPGAVDGRALKVNETRSLGNRQYLVVASFEDKRFLLGVCPDRISLLSPLPDRDPRG